MQNALAILQFPLAAVPSAVPDAPTTSPDFAESFAAELTELEGDVAVADPTVAPSDPPVTWVAPILPVAALPPVGLHGSTITDVAPGEIGILVESEPCEVGLSLASADAGGQIAEEVTTNFAHFLPDQPKADLVPNAAADGPVRSGKVSTDVAPQPVFPGKIGPADPPPQTILHIEPPPRQAQGRLVAEEAKTAAHIRKTQPDEVTANHVGQAVSAVAKVPAPVDHPSTPKISSAAPAIVPTAPAFPSSVPPAPHVKEAAPAGQASTAVLPVLSDVVVDEVEAKAAEGEIVPPQASEGPKAEKPHKATPPDMPDMADTQALPAKPTETDSPVKASFWERFFTDVTDPQPASASPPGQAVVVTADRAIGVVGLSNRLVLGSPETAEAGGPRDEVSDGPEPEAGDVATVNRPAATVGAGTLPSLAARPDLAPVLTVLPWVDSESDRVEDIDSGLSSLPLLSSGSPAPVTSGHSAPLSLPVQQVAQQLAGVLVQASDRATELALAPEELGKVRLRIEQDAANPDRLTISINVERPETLDLFRRHAGELAEAIRNAGYSGAHIDFGGQGQGSRDDRPQGWTVTGSEMTVDEFAPTQHTPLRIAGATLDLRL